MNKPIIIFPGSFNPPTTAHLLILRELQRQLPSVPVHLLPAPRTPHKDPASLAPFTHRLAMCRLLAAELADVTVSDFANQVSSSQTIDIITALRADKPDTHIIWVLGADSFVSLPVWHRWREVIEGTALFVLARPELTAQLEESIPAVGFAARRVTDAKALLQSTGWFFDADFNAPVSATAARAGDNNVLLPSVQHYISQYGVYKDTI